MGKNVNVHHVNNNDKVLAMHRWYHGGPGDDVVVVFNFSSNVFNQYRVGFPQGGEWKLRANTDADVYDVDFGEASVFDTVAHPHAYDGLPHSGIVSLPPYSALVFSQ